MNALLAATSLLFFAFAATRAARVSLTYDEAASYLRYIDSSVPFPYNTSALSVFNFEVATNHFLNTLLTKICWAVGGGREIVLRLPNLIGYAMFLTFSILILRPRVDPWIAVAGVALLNLNPYVIEFFSLSRGYGLSLAFLMGAIFFLLRLEAGRALAFASAAVMANFSLLNVYVSMFALIVAAGSLFASPLARPVVTRWWRLPVAAAIVAALVCSQDAGLSSTLFGPVEVTLLGLGGPELDRARVLQIDRFGKDRRLGPKTGAAQWRTNPGAYVRGLRVELPEPDAQRLQGIQLVIGSRALSSGADVAGWTSHDEHDTRVFEADAALSLPRSRLALFQPAINWAGDAHYAARLALATAWALLALALLAVVLKAAGWLIVRWNVLGRDLWRTLESSALWTTAFAGVPLYLLWRHDQLYFGGHLGLVQDTFYSLINNSFHGRVYAPAQTELVFAAAVSTVIAFAIVWYVSWRRSATALTRPALCVIALIALTALLEVVQRRLFQTLYLTERTALFFVPLYVLFLVFLCDAIASLAPAGRTLVRATLAAAVALSALHFVSTANTSEAFEWRFDAGTKAMMADLRAATRERPADAHILLGLDPLFAPVTVYYVRQTTGAIVDLAPAAAPGTEFFYGPERATPAGMRIIERYPATRTVLAVVR